MAVTIVLPRALLPYSHGTPSLAVGGPVGSVRDALASLGRVWPAVLDRIVTEQFAVREHVNVFVGPESIRFTDGLATPVRDGDTIMIVAAVSGG